jgi:hypothetical protein
MAGLAEADAARMRQALAAGRIDEAERLAKRVLTIRPAHAEARKLRAVLAWRRGDAATGLQQIRRAAASAPQDLEIGGIHARQAMEAGLFDEAIAARRRACARAPSRPRDIDLALDLLAAGRFDEGWAQHERRLPDGAPPTDSPLFAELARHKRPSWDGSAADGASVLVMGEAGFGDMIQFARYLPLVAARAARVIYKVMRPLGRLLKAAPSLAAIAIDDGPADVFPAFDRWVLAMSLPHRLGTGGDLLGARCPYLAADATPATLGGAGPGRPRVGIVWGGSPLQPRDPLRSLPPDHCAALLSRPGIEWHILQRGPHRAALPELRRRLAARGADPAALVAHDGEVDFADTAALMRQLDLVMTVDTSTAHLAGACGLAGWVLLSTVPDFRWLGTGADSPWYPSLRLFRQPAPQRWDLVVDAVHAALAQRFGV